METTTKYDTAQPQTDGHGFCSCCPKAYAFSTQQVPVKYQQYSRPHLVFACVMFLILIQVVLTWLGQATKPLEEYLQKSSIPEIEASLQKKGSCLILVQEVMVVPWPNTTGYVVSIPCRPALASNQSWCKAEYQTLADGFSKCSANRPPLPPLDTAGIFTATVATPPLTFTTVSVAAAVILVAEGTSAKLMILLLMLLGCIKKSREEGVISMGVKQLVDDHLKLKRDAAARV